MLVEALMQRQSESRASDAVFAELLGVSRATWGLTRTGKLPLGITVVRGAMRAYPDLEPLAVAFLRDGDRETATA